VSSAVADDTSFVYGTQVLFVCLHEMLKKPIFDMEDLNEFYDNMDKVPTINKNEVMTSDDMSWALFFFDIFLLFIGIISAFWILFTSLPRSQR
jgi:hypothetical protein